MIVKKAYFKFLFFLIFSFILMSPKALGADFLNGARLEGHDRYGTCDSITRTGWTSSVSTAIIATGEDFPDALSAAPLAKKYNAPILLTSPNTLDAKADAELTRLGVKTVYIIGGSDVVSSNVEQQITAKNIKCIRLYGSNRYETSAAVANAMGPSDKVVIAYGNDYPDALSIASWAASNGAPILLSDTYNLSTGVSNYLKSNWNGIGVTYVVGGESVINNSLLTKLKNPQRLGGRDRFATNIAVLSKLSGGFDFSRVFLATGNDFPDALSGSAMAALTKSPIILTDKGPLPDTKSFIDSKKSSINTAYILGGSDVVSDSTVSGLIPPICTSLSVSTSSNYVYLNKQIKATANITMLPSSASKPPVVFTAADPSIISVGADGTVTGLKIGTTALTVSAAGLSASVNVTVSNNKTVVIDPGHGGWSSGAVPTSPGGTQLLNYKESILNLQVSLKLRDRLQSQGINVVMTRDNDTYLSLDDRANISNSINPDVFISIHHDSYSSTSSGTSAYYSSYRPGIETQGVYVQAIGNGPVYGINDTDNTTPIGYLTNGQTYTYVKEGSDHNIYLMLNGVQCKTTLDYVMVYDSTPSPEAQKSKVLAESINHGIASLGLPQRGAFDENLAVTRLTNDTSVLVEVGFLSNYNEFLKISQSSFQDQVADKIAQSIISFLNNN
jgi:N-acetylmuramoyl-L-alanine amidase